MHFDTRLWSQRWTIYVWSQSFTVWVWLWVPSGNTPVPSGKEKHWWEKLVIQHFQVGDLLMEHGVSEPATPDENTTLQSDPLVWEGAFK